MNSVFKIYSPEDCDIYYDGELQGHIEGNSDRAFRFEVERKGMYRLKFINSEYQTELMMKVSIDADEEREVELDFSEVNEPVIQERIINAIEHDYEWDEKKLPKEILSLISNDGIVTIPKGVRKIGERAFYGCSDITSISIPDSVTSIGYRAFVSCSNLTSITIPNSVTSIGDWAFDYCSSLTAITIPDSVIKIGEGAFSRCSNLTAITIPDSVTSIGDWAFSDCSSLKSITIPDSVTTIGERAFIRCSSLTSITIPDSVTSIGDWAFSDCSSLRSFYCKATTPPRRTNWPHFTYHFISRFKIYVPKSKDSTVLEAYKSADGWKKYADIIEEYDFDNE